MSLSESTTVHAAASQLMEFLDAHPRTTVLTGAGCSTASGIPDYRDDEGRWKQREPMRYAQFVGQPSNRQRYWARSFSGWRRVSEAAPNRGHLALAELERRRRLAHLVTQNVDGLHQKAGSRGVTDLHGVLQRVRCLSCHEVLPRDDFQRELRDANPSWDAEVVAHAPDGDASLARGDVESFRVPECRACGGILKPDVVFFGESVPRPRVEAVYRHVAASDALLVIGSSLMVYSGYRFALAARKAGKPLLILNRGRTRADHIATHKLSGDCASILACAASLNGAR